MKNILKIVLLSLLIISCESEAEKKKRIEQERQQKIEREARIKKRQKEKAIYNKYINNSLYTGATPYAMCFGRYNSCSYGCSQIRVKAPLNSDVVVTIKRNGSVVRHAYIQAADTYTFEFPNGTYQAFFYYGKGWNPNKKMESSTCANLQGGFITDESFGKDAPQYLNNNILTYELILQKNGNFQTKSSNAEEAL